MATYVTKDGEVKAMLDFLPKQEIDHLKLLANDEMSKDTEQGLPENILGDIQRGVDTIKSRSDDYRHGVVSGMYHVLNTFRVCQDEEIPPDVALNLVLWITTQAALTIPEDYDDGSTEIPDSDGTIH